MRRFGRALAASFLVALAAPAAGAAASSPPLGIGCATQSDGVRFCSASSDVSSFDGMPLDVNVTLPPAPRSGADGQFPLVIIGHGYGNQKKGLDQHEAPWIDTAHQWALRGYAVLSNTDRGWWGSCGTPASRAANPNGCATGWVRLMQTRYEVRDAQYLTGELVDEGWVNPQRIGATGESYGGGESLALATLKDRIMNLDGSFAPWKSPNGVPLRIAGAAPTIPWSDLISSLVPNGHGLDYTITGPTDNFTPAGVEKQSYVAGLYALQVEPSTGQPVGYYAPPGADPDSDLTNWLAAINAGEPYDGNPEIAAIIKSFVAWRGPYYILDGTSAAGADNEAPAPLLLSSGFTDDLFPVDETVRYYNLERSRFPHDPVSLVYMDYGHARGQNKAADVSYLDSKLNAWLDHYVKGSGANPGQTAAALTQTCPASAPSGGPFVAGSWASLHPGTITFSSPAAQTILSSAGDPTIAKTIDPIAGGGACATVSAADQTGVATYRLPAASGSGYTLLGAPTISANLAVIGTFPELAMRLWDVDPSSGMQTLVARGVYRPSGSGPAIFQLHPGAWQFAPGHVPKLELLGQDPPYLRVSNGKFTIAVSNLELFLPTHDTSGNGIQTRVSLPLPPGATPAPH
jgi:hypothetical protein